MIFTDFDGTVSNQDICFSMVKKYAGSGWEQINHWWEEGVLSTRECAQRTLDIMQVNPVELHEYFHKFSLDHSFLDFVNWSKAQDFPLYILSDGYDNYIKILLENHSLNVPYYANHLEFKEKWYIKSPYIDWQCDKCGTCKTGIIKQKLLPGYISVYIGDGYSDRCPAEYCDIVFAKKSLAEYCRKQNILFYPFSTFHDVQKSLDQYVRDISN